MKTKEVNGNLMFDDLVSPIFEPSSPTFQDKGLLETSNLYYNNLPQSITETELKKIEKDFNDKYSKIDYYMRYIQVDLKKEMEDKVNRANDLNNESLKVLNRVEDVIEKLNEEKEINRKLEERLKVIEEKSKKYISELENKLNTYDELYKNMRKLFIELLANKISEESLDFDNSIINEIRDEYSEKFINLCLLVEDLSNRIKLELLEKDEQLSYIVENVDHLNTITSKKVKISFFKKLLNWRKK